MESGTVTMEVDGAVDGNSMLDHNCVVDEGVKGLGEAAARGIVAIGVGAAAVVEEVVGCQDQQMAHSRYLIFFFVS
jgi:hypothetical protein